MERDRWDTRGDAEMTEHWRSVVPALSLDPASDQTDVANGWERAVGVRRRYALELNHLAQSERSPGSVTTRLTRISDWSPLTGEERDTHRPDSPFALSRGIPSGLIAGAGARVGTGVDYALLISIAPLFLCSPGGCLFLEGVPLVVHRIRRFRPVA
jgi:hypothetical protein